MKELLFNEPGELIRQTRLLATGEYWLDLEANRQVAVERIAEPTSPWAKQVDAIEAPFASEYDEAEYENWALQMLNLAEFDMLSPSGLGAVLRRERSLSGLNVLDVGCGTGRIALWGAASGANVTALDQTSSYVEILADKAARLPADCVTPRCVVTPAEELLAVESSFELITAMFAVLNHCEDWQDTISGLTNKLRPEGRVVLSMYGSPDAAIFEEMKDGLPYEPAILVRRAPGGLLLGDTSSDILPAVFPYPNEVTDQLKRDDMTISQVEPLLSVTAFYPRDPTSENVTEFMKVTKRRFGSEVVTPLADASSKDDLLIASLLADGKVGPDRIDEAAYFGVVADRTNR